jgi:hypothetical protein
MVLKIKHTQVIAYTVKAVNPFGEGHTHQSRAFLLRGQQTPSVLEKR